MLTILIVYFTGVLLCAGIFDGLTWGMGEGLDSEETLAVIAACGLSWFGAGALVGLVLNELLGEWGAQKGQIHDRAHHH